jgi:hypothetical protein
MFKEINMGNLRKIYTSILILCLGLIVSFYPTTRSEPNFNPRIGDTCTIFTVSSGNTTFFGNNEDWGLNKAYMWCIPAQRISTFSNGERDIYGAIFLGFDNNLNDFEGVDGWEQGGMNEYGLCFDVNGLPDYPLNHGHDKIYPYTNHVLAQALWECKNVSEVIAWYGDHKWDVMGGQVHYADASGDAVVVSASPTGEWAFTRINSSDACSYLVSTNFNLANPENGQFPCDRFDVATQMLEEIADESHVTVSKCAEILHATHQEWFSGTKYSNVFDPVSLKIYFNQRRNFSHQKQVDLMEMLNEETEAVYGFLGVNGDIQVYMEKIDIQYRSPLLSPGWWVFFGVVGLTGGITSFFVIRKRRKK